ncbi:MAG: Gfo/Idh/MocA family oxidoreductase [Thermoguttaceae bacterium]|nr:Gfo/Idh/MocA family oxidoreductase [Thermoguttaceae bacterium]
MKLSRRQMFQMTALYAAAGTSGFGVPAYLPKAFGNDAPNSRLRVGAIGVGHRGRYDASLHQRHAELAVLADLDRRHLDASNHALCKGKAETVGDYRRILDRQDIDVVCIATPDHWHTKICLDALAAGKHVFCEKPLTLTIQEDQVLREKVKAHPKQIMAVGTQRRCELPRFTRAVNMVQQGVLGKMKRILVSLGKPLQMTSEPPQDQRFAPQPVPEELDWNTWQGQAPDFPFIPQRCHRLFRNWFEYAGGKITDWGAHYLDMALWATGQDQPNAGIVWVDPSDCKYPLPMKDGFPTASDYYNVPYDFYIKTRTQNGVAIDIESRLNDGILFEGEKGRIFVNCGRITGKPIEEEWDRDLYGDAQLKKIFKGKPVTDHMTNFYLCVREGGEPVSDVFTHTRTMTACHVVNIAMRLKRTLEWDPAAEQFVNDAQADSFISREQRKGFEVF